METRKERIERLKNNKEAFYFLSDEDKELLEEMRDTKHLMVINHNGGIINNDNNPLYQSLTFRIHKDYKEPEDKFVVYEVKLNKSVNRYYYYAGDDVRFIEEILPGYMGVQFAEQKGLDDWYSEKESWVDVVDGNIKNKPTYINEYWKPATPVRIRFLKKIN